MLKKISAFSQFQIKSLLSQAKAIYLDGGYVTLRYNALYAADILLAEHLEFVRCDFIQSRARVDDIRYHMTPDGSQEVDPVFVYIPVTQYVALTSKLFCVE